jgi:hypothetical protein
MGLLALALCCWPAAAPAAAAVRDDERGWRSIAGLWAIAAVVICAAFSLIDWRQTKHLALLIPLLLLGIGRIGGVGRAPLIAVSILLTGVLLWNAQALYSIWDDPFGLMRKIPEW